MRTHTALATLLLLAVSTIGAPVSAQTTSAARLLLRVVDQTGAVLPSATVTIYTLDGKPATTVTADAQGIAAFPSLPAGVAQVQAVFPGFAPYIEGTRLKAGKNAQTVTLKLAPVSELVVVTAGPEEPLGGS